jgi:hypothetical protein
VLTYSLEVAVLPIERVAVVAVLAAEPDRTNARILAPFGKVAI